VNVGPVTPEMLWLICNLHGRVLEGGRYYIRTALVKGYPLGGSSIASVQVTKNAQSHSVHAGRATGRAVPRFPVVRLSAMNAC